jgi:hypothetical protein
MTRVLALVEGATEKAVFDSIIAPHLGMQGVFVYARIVGKPGHKGGIRSFKSVLRELTALIKQEPESIVTTFFDYYGLPGDWPGIRDFRGQKSNEIADTIETAIADVVIKQFNNSFNPKHFIPYIQMYELESLLFSEPEEMSETFGYPEFQEIFEKIVEDCGGCEEINDNPRSHPSKRIETLYPLYKKGQSDLTHAPRIAKKIKINPIREACPHFNKWLTQLERLSNEGLI